MGRTGVQHACGELRVGQVGHAVLRCQRHRRRAEFVGTGGAVGTIRHGRTKRILLAPVGERNTNPVFWIDRSAFGERCHVPHRERLRRVEASGDGGAGRRGEFQETVHYVGARGGGGGVGIEFERSGRFVGRGGGGGVYGRFVGERPRRSANGTPSHPTERRLHERDRRGRRRLDSHDVHPRRTRTMRIRLEHVRGVSGRGKGRQFARREHRGRAYRFEWCRGVFAGEETV
mmetsp:Transcript_31375/g.66430  ORF Transcript_31375/g.66430 Transcript_31375/m.66430 type:complete len:231 (-) Transcript_31375:274-966(-)